MRAAAKELEFERAAALRDEIQDIRLRVLEEDASVKRRARGREGSRAGPKPLPARPTAKPTERVAAQKAGQRRGRRALRGATASGLEVTSVTVLPAEEEPADTLDGQTRSTLPTRAPPPIGCRASATSTRATTRAGWRAGSTADLGPTRHAQRDQAHRRATHPIGRPPSPLGVRSGPCGRRQLLAATRSRSCSSAPFMSLGKIGIATSSGCMGSTAATHAPFAGTS